MADNPFQSPSTTGQELSSESLPRATLRGAKWGAAIGAAIPLAFMVFMAAATVYVALTDPARGKRLLDGFAGVMLGMATTIPGLALLGAACGAALLWSRAWGRRRARTAKDKNSKQDDAIARSVGQSGN